MLKLLPATPRGMLPGSFPALFNPLQSAVLATTLAFPLTPFSAVSQSEGKHTRPVLAGYTPSLPPPFASLVHPQVVLRALLCHNTEHLKLSLWPSGEPHGFMWQGCFFYHPKTWISYINSPHLLLGSKQPSFPSKTLACCFSHQKSGGSLALVQTIFMASALV